MKSSLLTGGGKVSWYRVLEASDEERPAPRALDKRRTAGMRGPFLAFGTVRSFFFLLQYSRA